MNERAAGMLVGMAVGIVLIALLFKVYLKRKNLKTEYDERQTLIIGTAYKYGFFGMAMYECLFTVLSSLDISLPATYPVIHFTAVVVGVLIFACYAVWNGAYFGIFSDAQHKAYVRLLIAIGVVNFISAGVSIAAGDLISDGQLQSPFINLLCGIMMILIPVLSYFRSRATDDETEE